MLRVRDLTELAWTHDAAAFASRLGPFVLVQQPVPKARVAQVREGRAPATEPVPSLTGDALPALGKFEELLVATLPDPKSDGTVELVIGRDPESDLRVEDPSVSARHAAIRWDGKKGIIVELGSANGTFINRKKMASQARLWNGDELSFGLSSFVFLLAAEFHARLRENPAPR